MVIPNTQNTALILSGGGLGGAGFQLAIIEALVKSGELIEENLNLVVGTSAGACLGSVLATTPGGFVEPTRVAERALAEGGRMLGVEGLITSFKGRLRGGWRGLLIPGVGDAQRIAENALEELGDFCEWPTDRNLSLVAWDVGNWERHVFTNKDRDVTEPICVAQACAASAALPPFFAPYRIGEQSYLDGSLGSNSNADLAEGYTNVIIISALTGHGPDRNLNIVETIVRHKHQAALDAEIFHLQQTGTRVALYEPTRSMRETLWHHPFNRETGMRVWMRMRDAIAENGLDPFLSTRESTYFNETI